MNTFIPGALERFIAEDAGEPIVMLNLLRFQPEGGRERYAEYLAAAGPLVARYRAEIIHVADGLPPLAAEPGQAWDAVVLVRYPSRRAFADMVTDPDYQAVNALRVAALREAVLQPVVSKM